MASPELDDLTRAATDALHVGVGFAVLALQHTTDQRRVVAEHLAGARQAVEALRGQVVAAAARRAQG